MDPYYPPLNFHFKVSFFSTAFTPGSEDFRFQSVSGLTAEVVTETYKEGGQNQHDHELPVKTQYPDLILKRGLFIPNTTGVSGDLSGLQQWCQQMMQSLLVRPADIVIDLLNPAGRPVMSWNVKRAWPKKWLFHDFNAEENQVVIETMELHYDYFTII